MDTKAIIVIQPDGTETELDISQRPFDWERGREILGGWIEPVRVLRADILDRYQFTFMLVDEEGKIKDKPANDRATAIYLASVERQFPEAANPAAAANATFDAVAAVEGRNVIHTEPREERDHPRIFGTAIWFRGYTCEECIEREWI